MTAILPFLMLSISIVSFLWYRWHANDIYRVLALGLGAIGTIWGFAIAHWSILVACLLVLLLSFDARILKSANLSD